MRNPVDPRFQKITALMQSGLMIGKDRPVGRVTFTKEALHSSTSQRKGIGTLRWINRENPSERELHFIRTIDINRSIDQDAATCTITMWNTAPNQLTPTGIDTEGTLGYLTPGRGLPGRYGATTTAPSAGPSQSIYTDVDGNPYPSSWGYSPNSYQDALIPNTVLRTFQGYGSDNFDEFGEPYDEGNVHYVAPKNDTQLYQTGVWLIDKVNFSADGTISIECRDLAKLLIEQIIYPPVLPLDRFPLMYRPAKKPTGHHEIIGRNVASHYSSSADLTGTANRSIFGHRASHAFDGKQGTFWLSDHHTTSTSVAWIQAQTHGKFNEVVLTGYANTVAYVHVRENGRWQGNTQLSGSVNDVPGAKYVYVIAKGDTLWDLADQYYGDPTLWPHIANINNNIRDPHWIYPGQRIKIPYIEHTNFPPPNPGDGLEPVHDNIPYVAKATIGKSGRVTIPLPRVYSGTHVRTSFSKLPNVQKTLGLAEATYRAAVREMTVRNHTPSNYKPGNVNVPSHILDWSEAIKELAAWAGFTDPDVSPAAPDPMFGRANKTNAPLGPWGHYEWLGAGPVYNTPSDYFIGKSFADGIRQIVDFIGGIFYIDENGGAQFRLPNIWSGGNYLTEPTGPASLSRHTVRWPIEFHENANLISYSAQIDDSNLRTEILVIGGYPNVNTKYPVAGGYITGYNPETGKTSSIDFSDILAGQYRLMQVPSDQTKPFYTAIECQRMAELSALFILFTYRVGSLHAPCHPGLQIDDQVRIFERVTHERYVHYVSGITSHMDLEGGEYTMDVTTHWLGGDPNKDWFPNKQVLTPAVKNLEAIIKRVSSTTGA